MVTTPILTLLGILIFITIFITVKNIIELNKVLLLNKKYYSQFSEFIIKFIQKYKVCDKKQYANKYVSNILL